MMNRKFLKNLLLASPVVLLAACSEQAAQQDGTTVSEVQQPVSATTSSVSASMEADSDASLKVAYEQALIETKAAVDKAASVGGEWRDTRWAKSKYVKWTSPDGKTLKGSYMSIAAEAAKAGDYAKALDLLKTARFQGDMGYQQAIAQQGAGPLFASASSGPSEAEVTSFEDMLAATISAAEKAASVGGEWRDLRWKKSTFVKWTKPDGSVEKGSFVEIAKKAAAAGDMDKAMSLLKTAKFQAEMGYEQALSQKDARPML